jgi:hypothetical protein
MLAGIKKKKYYNCTRSLRIWNSMLLSVFLVFFREEGNPWKSAHGVHVLGSWN